MIVKRDAAVVGVFDSGVGGLSILREILAATAATSYIYIADQGWAPYGVRSLTEVRDRSFALVDHLLEGGAQCIVVACNTASAAALHELRLAHPDIPFVGMEPAVKPAVTKSNRGIVGVLATRATFQGELYGSVVDRHASDVALVERVGTGLVELVESGELSGSMAERALRECLAPMMTAGIDTLVLGCTHYPFLRPVMESILGPGVEVVDPAPAVARQLVRVLASDGDDRGRQSDVENAVQYVTSGNSKHFMAQIGTLLNMASEDVAVRKL